MLAPRIARWVEERERPVRTPPPNTAGALTGRSRSSTLRRPLAGVPAIQDVERECAAADGARDPKKAITAFFALGGQLSLGRRQPAQNGSIPDSSLNSTLAPREARCQHGASSSCRLRKLRGFVLNPLTSLPRMGGVSAPSPRPPMPADPALRARACLSSSTSGESTRSRCGPRSRLAVGRLRPPGRDRA